MRWWIQTCSSSPRFLLIHVTNEPGESCPSAIGVMGVAGLKDQSTELVEFRLAMAAPADRPEFKGTVVAVPTAPFWADELGDIDAKRAQISQMKYFLDSKHKDHANLKMRKNP